MLGLQGMAFFDEISSVHEEELMCASVHLVSGVLFKCTLNFLAYNVNQFSYFLLSFHLENSVLSNMYTRASLLHYY